MKVDIKNLNPGDQLFIRREIKNASDCPDDIATRQEAIADKPQEWSCRSCPNPNCSVLYTYRDGSLHASGRCARVGTVVEIPAKIS